MYAHAGLKDNDPTGALGGTETEPTLKVPHVLADGADSMGVLMASTRVYVNEGMMHDLWVSTTWALNPFDIKESVARKFKPGEFDLIGTARKDPNSPWMQTEKRMPNMALFLTTWDSFPLKDAIEIDRAGTPRKDRKDYLTTDADVLKRGKIAFADNCAACHSSKRPNPMPADPQQQKQAWRDLVLSDDFLADNYLSDDQRHPLSELGTNAQRAMGTNAMGGHTWGQMSSQTYKDERVPSEPLQDQGADGKPIPLYDPLTGKNIKFEAPASFYRTPTLVSVWATAPYLHNNALGIYTGDPSAKQSEPKATSVEMKSISYDPKSVEVPVGGSIVSTNKAFTNHTATSEDDGKTFDTGEIKPGETSSPMTFDKEGEFNYHCKIHGKTMNGTVVVKPQ
jgi:plastocyanin/mono/diheme cytochrome c family protein